MTRPRVVIAGLGDTGLLTARHLSRHVDVVGISTKPALVSGQELGMRLARPDEWAREYFIGFDRYRKLDGVRTVHGSLTDLSLTDRIVGVRLPDGTTRAEPYDVLVIATGVTNGFWRRPDLQSDAEVAAALMADHEQLATAESINVIGGGAAAVSAAANLALAWPDTRVALYYPGERALPQHHRRVWAKVLGILTERGVSLHPGHRAIVPTGFELDRITTDPVAFSTGQPDAPADATSGPSDGSGPTLPRCPTRCWTRTASSGSLLTSPSSGRPGCSPSATSRLRIRCAVRPATGPTGCSPGTSGAIWPGAHSAATAPAVGVGARSSGSSRTDCACSRRRDDPFASRRGRSKASCSPGSYGAASTAASVVTGDPHQWNATSRHAGDAVQRRRRSVAQRVSSWRDESWSLRSTDDMWVSTVLIEMNSSAPTSL